MSIDLNKYTSLENLSSFSRLEEETNFDSVSTIASSVIPSDVALETVKRSNDLRKLRDPNIVKLQLQITNHLLNVNGKKDSLQRINFYVN